MAASVAVDERMVSRNRNIVSDADIAVLATANLDSLLDWVTSWDQVLRVHNMEHFFVVALQTLQDDKVFFGFFDPDDVHDLVFVRNFEREVLLADLAVDFVEPHHLLAFVCLLRALGLEPVSQAQQMDGALSSHAFARRDKWIELGLFTFGARCNVFFLCAPTDLTDCLLHRLLGDLRVFALHELLILLRHEDLVPFFIDEISLLFSRVFLTLQHLELTVELASSRDRCRHILGLLDKFNLVHINHVLTLGELLLRWKLARLS